MALKKKSFIRQKGEKGRQQIQNLVTIMSYCGISAREFDYLSRNGQRPRTLKAGTTAGYIEKAA